MVKIRWKTAILTLAIFIAAGWSGCLSAAETKEFSFVHITDIHIPTYLFAIGQPLDEATLMQMHNQQRLQQLVNECLVMEPKPAFVINTGDTGDVGWIPFLKLYQKLMQPLVSAGIPVYTEVGNHDFDYAGIGVQDLAEIFDPLGPALIGRHGTRYSFDYGGCHFILMQDIPIQGLIRLTPTDIEWLRKDLNSVKKDTRILLFLHGNVPEGDTHDVVELLQTFKYPVIFQGHAHSESIRKWGGVPVVVTGALWGGNPKAGSYRLVTVKPDKIVVQTKDFAKQAGTLEPGKTIEIPQPGPQVHIIAPKNNTLVSGNVTLTATTKPVVPGVMEYSIPGFNKWTPMSGGNGKWETVAPMPTTPGHHLLALQFKGENGSIVLAHTVIRIPGEKVREAWTKDLGSTIQGAPVIWQDVVIVPTIELGVYALRLDDGKVVWHRKVEQGQILGRVVTDGTTVFIGAGRIVLAIDPKTGKLLWQTSLNGSIVADFSVGNGKLFIPAGEHKLFCLDTRQGKILWDYTVGLPILMEPATDGNRVFFGAIDGFVRALDVTTGKEIWKNQVSSMDDIYITAPYWPPVIAGDKVIVSKRPAKKEEKNLIAFIASNGNVNWSRQLAVWPVYLVASPEKDKLYTSFTQNGKMGLQCLSVEDGSSLWNQVTGVGMNAGIVSRNVVIVRDDDDICCVEAATGKVQWTYKPSIGPQGWLHGPLALAVKDNLAIVGTLEGQVIALKW